MSRILDKSFKYVPSHETDLKKRFAKMRAELKAKAAREAEQARVQAAQNAANAAEASSKTISLKARKK